MHCNECKHAFKTNLFETRLKKVIFYSKQVVGWDGVDVLRVSKVVLEGNKFDSYCWPYSIRNLSLRGEHILSKELNSIICNIVLSFADQNKDLVRWEWIVAPLTAPQTFFQTVDKNWQVVSLTYNQTIKYTKHQHQQYMILFKIEIKTWPVSDRLAGKYSSIVPYVNFTTKYKTNRE